MYSRLTVIIVLLLLMNKGQAQSNFSGVEVGGLAGQMLDIYPNMPQHDLQRGGFMSLRCGGKSPYRELYNNVESGIQASFHDLGNPSVLGYGIGIQYQATFNQYITRRIRSFQRFNVGGIYVTKPYDYLNNQSNNVFGSDVSALLSVSAGVRYKFRQNAIALQASYWHSSNAHTVLPNVGMNVPMVMLSIEKFFHIEDIYIMEEKEPFSIDSRFGLMLYGAMGFNEAGGTVRPTNGNTYRKQLAGIGATYRFRTIHRVSLSLEGYHDDAYALWNNSMEWANSKDNLASSALMLILGHEFIFGHFGWIVNAGVNLYNPTLDRIVNEVEQRNFSSLSKRYVPGRFAVRYYFNKSEKHLGAAFVQLGVKSNLGQADFMEIGIGCLISKKQG